jgi:mono/diheme cytochrome c family protein
MRNILGSIGIGAVMAAMLGCSRGPFPPTPVDNTIDPATPAFYSTNVRPIFQKYCYRCHAGMNRRGGLTITTQAGLIHGGQDGQVLVPGDPAASLLVKLIRHEGTKKIPGPMPSKSAKLSDEDIVTVERWVRAGAIMPPDPPLK